MGKPTPDITSSAAFASSKTQEPRTMRAFIALAILVVAASAASFDKDAYLEKTLKRLLDLEMNKKAKGDCPTNNACSGRGSCNDSEDPYGMGYYCSKCTGKSGGRTCEIVDPCAAGADVCAASGQGNGYTGCQRTSTKAEGYFCTDPSYVYRNQLLRNLEENAQEEPYASIRMRLMSNEDETVDEAVMHVMRKRLLES